MATANYSKRIFKLSMKKVRTSTRTLNSLVLLSRTNDSGMTRIALQASVSQTIINMNFIFDKQKQKHLWVSSTFLISISTTYLCISQTTVCTIWFTSRLRLVTFNSVNHLQSSSLTYVDFFYKQRVNIAKKKNRKKEWQQWRLQWPWYTVWQCQFNFSCVSILVNN